MSNIWNPTENWSVGTEMLCGTIRTDFGTPGHERVKSIIGPPRVMKQSFHARDVKGRELCLSLIHI